jgi:outer membrane lipoprotein carrier protein
MPPIRRLLRPTLNVALGTLILGAFIPGIVPLGTFPPGRMLAQAPTKAATPDLKSTLKSIEDHYNKAQSLQLSFSETYRTRGRTLLEKGDLTLRKPGKMRWQYSSPAGKLFISDGKFIWTYLPQENRAEKVKFKETDDMRAPLAFLLGKLDFARDFKEYHSQPDQGGLFITAIPKSDKLPYTEVSFLAMPDSTIRRLEVKGQDNSTLQFTFENEKSNPTTPDSLFTFTPPKGTEFVDLSNQ